MNPITNAKNLQKINEKELELGIVGKKSWHDEYKDSAWIFVGGLPYDLSEGDVVCVFSQYGEIVNINLVRDKSTGKSKGFAFICYEDQRSTILAVDNLNTIKILNRIIRVDHVKDYKIPKEHEDEDEVTKLLRDKGCAPKLESSSEPEEEEVKVKDKRKDSKKSVKRKKKKKKKETSSESSDDSGSDVSVKKEKHDPGYDKALHRNYKPDNIGRISEVKVEVSSRVGRRENLISDDRQRDRRNDRDRERHSDSRREDFRDKERHNDSWRDDRERHGDSRREDYRDRVTDSRSRQRDDRYNRDRHMKIRRSRSRSRDRERSRDRRR